MIPVFNTDYFPDLAAFTERLFNRLVANADRKISSPQAPNIYTNSNGYPKIKILILSKDRIG